MNIKEKNLHKAVNENFIMVIKQMIRIGANINKKDNDDWTPMQLASDNSHTEIVKLLKKYGDRK